MNKNLLAYGAIGTFALAVLCGFKFTELVAKHIREENSLMNSKFEKEIKELKEEVDKLKKSSK